MCDEGAAFAFGALTSDFCDRTNDCFSVAGVKVGSSEGVEFEEAEGAVAFADVDDVGSGRGGQGLRYFRCQLAGGGAERGFDWFASGGVVGRTGDDLAIDDDESPLAADGAHRRRDDGERFVVVVEAVIELSERDLVDIEDAAAKWFERAIGADEEAAWRMELLRDGVSVGDEFQRGGELPCSWTSHGRADSYQAEQRNRSTGQNDPGDQASSSAMRAALPSEPWKTTGAEGIAAGTPFDHQE